VLDFGTSVLVLVASVALLWTLYENRRGASAAASLQVEDVRDVTIDGNATTKRAGHGPIVVVEFADFQCPFCARHARDTFPDIRREFIDSGRVTYFAFALPLRMHPLARKAAEAAECAAREGKYWQIHERLFQAPIALTPHDLLRAAQETGLDMGRFEPCLTDGAVGAVATDIQQATRLGVRSTPTFFVGRLRKDGQIDAFKRINGAVPFGEFKAAVETVAAL
jgi:protein-disulfide isomerase